MSIDPQFERAVLAELALSERRGRRRDPSHGARAVAERLHRGRRDLLAHLRRVADAVARTFRAVGWLHHAPAGDATLRALTTAGVTRDEAAAVELFGAAPALRRSVLHWARGFCNAPGRPGQLARVVARAAIEDRLDGAQPSGETLTAVCLLPDLGLAA
jgi:hypothetical protein